ncbi:DUF4097 family beta strand repeat-containing protein [Paenibacillus durus]|uniref:Uncharacterized protein n=1 Tax=Paenibacillus durus ATCC 35681 TaxID=1333534 RepID=A0A0F7F9V8_PAEDU|nr:DUF4097 family beta strand repeat-containing protein [Paenibacillus durus]AKG35248.1 hypothetical protein VK70_12230 [Paenibacillus durus ATCC 35681]
MRKSMKKVTMAALLAALLLAGCTPLPGKSADSASNEMETSMQDIGEAAKTFGETVQQNAGEIAGSAAQTIEDTADHVSDQLKFGRITKELSTQSPVGSASALVLDNSVGDIEVKPGRGADLKVTATIISYNTLGKKDDSQHILDNAEVSIRESNGALKVNTHPQDKPDTDFWSWASRTYGTSDFSISYIIEIPASINRYDIKGDVGKIKLHELTGTYHISSDVGSVSVEDAHITGKSSISTDTGSISLGIAEMDRSSSLTANTDVGSISAALKQSVSCTLDADTDLGRVSGVPSGKSDINGGGPLLSLSSSVGAINVTK